VLSPRTRHLLPLLLSLAPLAAGCGGYGTRLAFNGGELYYTGAVTGAEAERLGQFLVREQFFDGRPKTAQLGKDGDSYQFRFVALPGLADDAGTRRDLGLFGGQIRQEVLAGAPLVLRACDEHLRTLRAIQADSLHRVGPGKVYDTAAVGKDQAEQVGGVLVALQLFDGTPKTVQLDREGEAYLCRLTAPPGADADAELAPVFKQLRAELSRSAFGGKPVALHLCDGTMKLVKVVTGE